MHQTFQFTDTGRSRFQLLLIGSCTAVQLLVLHADDLRQQAPPVVFGILCLFPDVGQNKLFQSILIDGAGAFSTAGIAATEKGTVPSRPAVLVGKPLDLVAHFESAVRAVDKAGKNTLDAIGGIGFAHPFLVDSHHCVPNLAGDDRLMVSALFQNVDFRRNGMSFFAGQHTGVIQPYTPRHLPA